MKLSVGNIGWFVCLIGLGVLTISAIDYKKDGGVTSVSVDVKSDGEGDQFLSESDVRDQMFSILGGQLPEDVSSISVEQLEKQMKTNPFVKNADVYINSDGELGIRVEQRSPVARVLTNGEHFYLDAEGKVIPESQSFTARLLVLTGDVPVGREREGYADQALIELIHTLGEDAFYDALVEQINFEKDELTVVPKVGSAFIKFGENENVDKKLSNLKAFYRDVYSQKGFEGYSQIDISIEDQIICKDNKKTN